MGSIDDVVTELRSVLADLQRLDLWPPWDAAQTVVDLAAQAATVATQPPEPAPEAVDDAAVAWRRGARDVERAGGDLELLSGATTTDVWKGHAGEAFRTSLARLASRLATVPVAIHGVDRALATLSKEMTAARDRHAHAFDELRQQLSPNWPDLLPWQLTDYVAGLAAAVAHAVEELIGAYSEAAEAIAVARRGVVTAMDGVELPDHLPHGPGVSALDVVNAWDDHSGPLRGTALGRYDEAFAALGTAKRRAVLDALDGAADASERGWILAGVAAGLSGATLLRYLRQLHELTPHQRERLDPTGHHLKQPDDTSCGSASLVMSRMVNNPAYAMWVMTGYDPATGDQAPHDQSAQDRFDAESLAMHDRTNALHDRDGDLQAPYPEIIGTQPWAVAHEMSAAGGSGIPGAEYDVTVVDPDDRGATFDAIVAASEDGHTVPVFVGDHTRPGHIALVTGSDGDGVTVYDPGHGEHRTVSRAEFEAGRVHVGTWDEPWFAVVPR